MLSKPTSSPRAALPAAEALYERALRDGGELLLHLAGRAPTALPVARWLGSADAVDRQVLAGVCGPVLDLGCGPGRHLGLLARRGIPALGVDRSSVALDLAARHGQDLLRVDVLAWEPPLAAFKTALLLDGNIGMGGRPESVLTTVRHALASDGVAIVELGDDADPSTSVARLGYGTAISRPFAWSSVGGRRLSAAAERCGLRVLACEQLERRTFVWLRR